MNETPASYNKHLVDLRMKVAKGNAVTMDIRDAARLQEALTQRRIKTRTKRVVDFFRRLYEEDLQAVLEDGSWKHRAMDHQENASWTLTCDKCGKSLVTCKAADIDAFLPVEMEHICQLRPVSPIVLDSDTEADLEARTGVRVPTATMTELYCNEHSGPSDDEIVEATPTH